MYRKRMINSINNIFPLGGAKRGKVALPVPCGTNHGGVFVESVVMPSYKPWWSYRTNYASLMALVPNPNGISVCS